ncbi:MAG TPA: DNA repair protein RecO [Propionibacteriaceae bacterium]|nr:DNA repair protein RecO [Propionibacteriaceae bacterium]
MPTYTDEAVVLRTHNLGEADRIVTLLTRRHGKVRAVARGVRRSTSKFGARLEPFSHVDLQLVVGRSLDIVAQAVSRDAFGEPLVSDYPRYTAGHAMLEAADRLVGEEGEPSVQHYLLLVGALRALGSGDDRPSAQILDSYLLRALAVAGYAPSLAECALCGSTERLEFFNPSTGGMACATCRPTGSARVDISTARHLGMLLAGDWDGVVGASPVVQRTASGLVSAFAAWHIERGLRSLAHVER